MRHYSQSTVYPLCHFYHYLFDLVLMPNVVPHVLVE
jgi:hypothetical protein